MSDPLSRLMGWHLARHLLFWLPVFQLYLSGRVGLADALVLEGIYYAAVFALEVPTGWISDRLGRRVALVAAPLCWGAGALGFALSDGFMGFALAQLGFAAGMATGSGSDTAWLYDHLVATGREGEHEAWETRAASRRLIGMALGAAGGAALGMVDLRAPYLAFAAACAVAAGLAATLPEPPRAAIAPSPWASARLWVSHMAASPLLRWGLAAEVALLVLVHVPYELYQPWLGVALGAEKLTIPASGLLAAGAAATGAWATRQVARLRARASAEAVMAGALAAITALCALMAAFPVAWLAPLVLLRSAPEAMATPVLRARLHPHLPPALGATWWSVQSLAGRAAFAVVLWSGASIAGGTHAEAVPRLLGAASALGVLLTAGVMAAAKNRIRYSR